jgi:hypothetical protein
MKLAAPVVLLLGLGACADAGAPRIVDDRADAVVLAWFGGSDLDSAALDIAGRHCADSGRVALVGERTDRGRAITRRYRCTAPPEADGNGITFRAPSGEG